MIDKQGENFKTLLNALKESSQNEMLIAFLPKILEKPGMFEKLIELGSKDK